MRLRRIRASGFLSFDGFDLATDTRVTMIVGPNGHGKSNVGHVLRLVHTAVAAADRTSPALEAALDTYQLARRQPEHADNPGISSREFDVAPRGIALDVEIELSTAWEMNLVTAFIKAATANALIGNTSGYDTTSIDGWIDKQITTARLRALHNLTLTVTQAGHADSPWRVSAAFTPTAGRARRHAYRWLLRGWPGTDQLIRADESDDVINHLAGSRLADRLLGRSQPPAKPIAPAGAFTLARMLPAAGRTTTDVALDLGRPPTRHVRAFTDAINNDLLGNRESNDYCGLSRVLRLVLDNALHQTADERFATPNDNRRRAPDTTSIAATQRLSERLLLLKNGPSSNRPIYDRVTARFSALTNGRQIDVALTAAPQQRKHHPLLPPPQQQGEHEQTLLARMEPQLVVSIRPTDFADRRAIAQVPLEFAGSGAGEALLLALELDTPADGVVLLDEPAATLHPSAQRALAADLAASPAQFIVITHAPYLVPYSNLRDVDLCRVELAYTEPPRAPNLTGAQPSLRSVVWRVDTPLLTAVATKVIAKGNQALPFAAGVILCEGQTDVAVIHVIADRAELNLEDHNIAVLDCGSRENLPDYVALASGLGVRHLVVADADSANAARNADVRKKANAVRDAVHHAARGTLFEFPEDVEHTLGITKARASTTASAAAAASQADFANNADLARLHALLAQFVTAVAAHDDWG